MPVRRMSRRQSRAQWHVGQIAEAPSGRKAMEAAWNWWLKELSELEESHARKTDLAQWDLAVMLGLQAARIATARVTRPAGLTDQEQHALLHPWDAPAEEDGP